MRNNTKKGFTLVELLVVIAILAILATVSVVGYTSFIESTNLTVDKDLATQLNHFLEAYKVNHREDITEDNIWHVTDEILELGGITELKTKSDDYHFFFKFDGQGGGEYVVALDKDVINKSGLNIIWNAIAGNEDNLKPGFFEFDGELYFLVSTTGSNLANAVRGFYTLDGLDGKNEAEQFVSFANALENLNQEDPVLGARYKQFANNAIFVTASGNFALGEGDHSELFVYDGAKFIDDEINIVENGVIKKTIQVTNETPLLSVTEDTTFRISGELHLMQNSLIIKAAEGKTATLVIITNGWSKVENNAEPGFVSENVQVVLSSDTTKTTHTVKGNFVYKSNDVTEGKHVASLKFNNPVVDFELKIDDPNATNYFGEEINGVVYDKEGYIVFDKINGGIQLKAINEIGKLGEEYAVSYPYYSWIISKVVLSDGTDVTADKDTYASIDSNGLLTLKSGYDFNIGYIEVTATARLDKTGTLDGAEEKASASFKVHVAAVSSVDVTIQKSDNTWSKPLASPYKVSVVHESASGTAYSLVHTFGYTNKLSNMTFNEAVSIEYKDDASKNVVTIGANGTFTTKAGGVANLIVKVGVYQQYDIAITVVDIASDLAVKVKDTGIVHIGSADAIKLSDLFTGTIPAGSNVVVFNGLLTNMDYMTPDVSSVALLSNNNSHSLYVNDKDYVLTDLNNKLGSGKIVNSLEDTLQLGGEKLTGDKITIAIFNNGVRVSPNVSVYVANANNIRENNNLPTSQYTNSVVLLGDIKLAKDAWFSLTGTDGENRATLYGNHFTFNIENGPTKGSSAGATFGIISLDNANMQDVRVVGKVFDKVGIANSDAFGINAVHALNNCLISNSYISNCRAPLSVGFEGGLTDNLVANDNVELKNCIIFGGKYCNIEIRNGTLTISDDVITINQPHTSDSVVTDSSVKTMGLGITFWAEARGECKLIHNNNLTQYNFINENDMEHLPPVTIKISTTLLGQKITIDATYSMAEMLQDMLVATTDGDVHIGYKYCTICQKTHNIGDTDIKEGKCCSATKHDDGCGGTHDHTLEKTYNQVLKYADFIYPNSEATSDRYANTGIVVISNSILSGLRGGAPSIEADKMPTGYSASSYHMVDPDGINGNTELDVNINLYLPNNTNTALDVASDNAEYKYSPWDNTVGEETYNAWDFDANGNIIH